MPRDSGRKPFQPISGLSQMIRRHRCRRRRISAASRAGSHDRERVALMQMFPQLSPEDALRIYPDIDETLVRAGRYCPMPSWPPTPSGIARLCVRAKETLRGFRACSGRTRCCRVEPCREPALRSSGRISHAVSSIARSCNHTLRRRSRDVRRSRRSRGPSGRVVTLPAVTDPCGRLSPRRTWSFSRMPCPETRSDRKRRGRGA